MDVFYRQYNTYRILLSILGLWPYHKSIYSTIHRISVSGIMLAYIIFEVTRIHYFYACNLCASRRFIGNSLVVLSLFKSGITFRGCIVTLSSTCPVVIYFMRYVTFVAVFPVVRDVLIWTLVQLYLYGKYVLFKSKKLQTTSVVAVTRLTSFASTKTFRCKDIMVSLNLLLILGLCCWWMLSVASYAFTPITLDLLLPLNESRRRYFSYVTMFSHERIEYIDIVCVNILVVHAIGMLSLAGTELMLFVFAHWMCGMFDITRYE
ncbi:uncharacterized protein LOC112214006 [Bombus impatiens]|uniref:Uncharacterized protein LOC112214006 n=1 Tax=Bombus impatiens TaxID=132113 RepID=A0A6P8LEE8_BOMIM|nr:uncharacterized protein LOC112214006 [Bombus impatiens]